MMDGAGRSIRQRTAVALVGMREETFAVEEGVLELHGQTGRAEGGAGGSEGSLLVAATASQGDSGQATCLVEIVIDVEGVKGRIQGAETGRMGELFLSNENASTF